MTGNEKRLLIYTLLIVTLLTGWSVWAWKNNTYMTYRDTPVEFVDRYLRQSCVKGFCSDRYEGRFRTEDGVYFERGISGYMFHRMHLGERMVLELRPMDIQQTSRDNLIWMFGTVALHLITVFAWLFLLVGHAFWWYDYFKEKKLNKEACNGRRKI